MRETSMSIAVSALDRGNWERQKSWCLDGYRHQGTNDAKLAPLRAYMAAMESLVNSHHHHVRTSGLSRTPCLPACRDDC